MDSNNHMDADSLLPPRKRLLAGLKRNNSDVTCHGQSNPNGTVDESNARSDNLMKSLSNNPHRSYEDIVEASRIAAEIAIAARANAEEKAAKAAKAITAAKNALELVSTITEEASLAEKYVRRSKVNNDKPVQTLYDRNKKHGNNNETDEELARTLHQAINSSPRISKKSSVTDTKNLKHKKPKNSAVPGKASIDYSDLSVKRDCRASTATDKEGSIVKVPMLTIDLNALKPNEDNLFRLDGEEKHWLGEDHQQNLESSEREVLELEGKQGESFDSSAKKRGRLKKKKLPLSIFSSKEEGQDRSPSSLPVASRSMPAVERSSLWTCQSLKVSADVKLNKVAQS